MACCRRGGRVSGVVRYRSATTWVVWWDFQSSLGVSYVEKVTVFCSDRFEGKGVLGRIGVML